MTHLIKKLIKEFIRDWDYHIIFFFIAIIAVVSIWFVVDKNKWLKAWQYEIILVPVFYLLRYYLLKKFWKNKEAKNNEQNN